MEKVSDGVRITSRGLSVFVEGDSGVIEIKPNELLDGFVSPTNSYSSLEEAVLDAKAALTIIDHV